MPVRRYLNSKTIAPLVGLILFGAAVYALHQLLKDNSLSSIISELRAMERSKVNLGIIFAVVSYGVLTLYDLLAMRFMHIKLSYRRIAFTSFIAYAFSHNIGLPLLTGTSVRYRIYHTWGLRALDVSLLTLFCGITYYVGLTFIGGLALAFTPIAIPPEQMHIIPFSSLQPVGLVALLIVAGYLLATWLYHKPIKLGRCTIPLPTPKLAFWQIVIAAVDWLIVGAVFYTVLPDGKSLTYAEVFGIFMLAQVASNLSNVPGGLGVFEAIVLALLSNHISTPTIISSLIVFRLIYFVGPFVIALPLFGLFELYQRRHPHPPETPIHTENPA